MINAHSIIAKIEKKNIASIKGFVKAGFVKKENQMV